MFILIGVRAKALKRTDNNKEISMKKQGFTLIELMVVVVIIGILAAVAVPKLFGMIAKSKASEIGPSAGEYVKVLNAYVAEKDSVDSWYKIGYKPAGSGSSNSYKTTTFTYTGAISKAQVTTTTTDKAWLATSNVKLNDCAASGTWDIKLVGAGSVGGEISFSNTVSSTDCEMLTPSFTKIGQ